MTTRRARRAKRVQERGLEWALGVLLRATRTASRDVDLITVSEALQIAREALGSLARVSERIALSEQMVTDFASVQNLCATVKKMYANRELDSVDVAVRLSRLPPCEQVVLAREHAKRRLTSLQVRDVVSLRRRLTGLTIRQAIQRVKSSADINTYVVRFPLSSGGPGVSALQARFARAVGRENVVSANAQGGVATLTITSGGRRRLQAAARQSGTTTRRLVEGLVTEGRRK